MQVRFFRHAGLVLILSLCFVLGACGRSSVPRFEGSTPNALTPTTISYLPTEEPVATSPAAPTKEALDGTIVIDTGAEGGQIDPRLFGTNAPAWLRNETSNLFADANFQERTQMSGVSVLRMPGGSWGNHYDWLGCETSNVQKGSEDGCYWLWAAKPSDYIDLLQSTETAGMWIVTMQGTPQEAAALVAFFNGAVDDTQVIGVDRNGRDWETVGTWATLRSEQGFPDPVNIGLWEVGNEIYGAKQGPNTPNCASFGWEDVWTCDPYEYVHGKDEYEGFLSFREAMIAVDSSIKVGAVGVPWQDEWGNWGNMVLLEAGNAMDFYSVHFYDYSDSTSNYADILKKPQITWDLMMDDYRRALQRTNVPRDLPVALTEYNLFAFLELDTDHVMRRAVNALYIADTLGQFAENGISMANQYDLSNGVDETTQLETYGMLEGPTANRTPQYYAFLLWSRFGSELLPSHLGFDAGSTLSAYAGRTADGNITLLVINKTNSAITVPITLTGIESIQHATLDVVQAETLEDLDVSLNGTTDPANDFSDAPSSDLGALEGSFEQEFPAYSISLLTLEP